MNNPYCKGCAHESTCKYAYKLDELLKNFGHFLSFICKYREVKPTVYPPSVIEKKDIHEGMEVSKAIYEGMQVSKFGEK